MKKTMVLLMAGVIGLLIINKALYSHSHQQADGSYLIHAHPYSKSADSNPIKSHHHNQAEYITLDALKILCAFSMLTLAIIAIFSSTRIIIHQLSVYKYRYLFLLTGRAPPVLHTTV